MTDTNSPPNPAFKRFDKLIGKWDLKGRTLNADEDNIFGWNVFEWLPGGHFLKSEGEINYNGFQMQSLEIIAYNPETQTFPSVVYSSMFGQPIDYSWDVQGEKLIHKGMNSTYTGTFSSDGSTLTGGWRPDDSTAANSENSYDAVMTRLK